MGQVDRMGRRMLAVHRPCCAILGDTLSLFPSLPPLPRASHLPPGHTKPGHRAAQGVHKGEQPPVRASACARSTLPGYMRGFPGTLPAGLLFSFTDEKLDPEKSRGLPDREATEPEFAASWHRGKYANFGGIDPG